MNVQWLLLMDNIVVFNASLGDSRITGPVLKSRFLVSETKKLNVFPDALYHRCNQLSFLVSRLESTPLLSLVLHVITGAVRTATKRAGGTVHNHGGSPGKRLGVKKFSGW